MAQPRNGRTERHSSQRSMLSSGDDDGSYEAARARDSARGPDASELTRRLMHPDYRHGLGGLDLEYATCPWCRRGCCAFHDDTAEQQQPGQ